MTYVKKCFFSSGVILGSYLKHERNKMETTYNNFPNPDDFYEGPSDEELKRIEEDLERYSD